MPTEPLRCADALIVDDDGQRRTAERLRRVVPHTSATLRSIGR
ncbi:hypothetical protein [Micromonospora halophytica]|nr:hypothetical protein [Micromonospora halophytica]